MKEKINASHDLLSILMEYEKNKADPHWRTNGIVTWYTGDGYNLMDWDFDIFTYGKRI